MRSAISVAAIAACASVAVARPQEGHVRCAASPSDSFVQKASKMALDEADDLFNNFHMADETIEIDTYFHVVASDEAESSNTTDQMLNDQIDVLNTSYEPHGIQFNLVNISRTVDANWAVDGAELDMKKSLRQGGYDSLNVYYMKEIGGNLGYCYFPDDIEEGSPDFIRDGCSVLATTVPGGSTDQYNLGGTTTHEVGHFLGLFHTFQGGCSGAGDEVADTPAQSSPSSGCPTNRDSCPGQEGADPIHNYMDYSIDECYEEFTPGQEKRMINMWNTYRAPGARGFHPIH
ncbi:hypothetical protein FQN54_003369 [Arachnomyces sp. PD_36]|nr:hypothetical protein FQN54_003369 [Arachnomyces sp. PD_36]